MVRLLGPADLDLLARAPTPFGGSGYHPLADLLAHGIVAAAIADDAIVSLAATAARADQYADLAVWTATDWRGQGLATAAAAQVARAVQAAGQIPVWSTGETNATSLRIARTLGFRAVARRVYLIRDDRATDAAAGDP